MKTTIKLSPTKKLIVTPCKTGGVTIDLVHGDTHTSTETIHLTEDEAGVLIGAIEYALPEVTA